MSDTKALQRAIEHMKASGELRICIGAGEYCPRPPKPLSGIIISDIGRLAVSRLTVKRLREIGTERHYRNYKYGPTHEQDTFELWETLEPKP
jgi:hypothetical protein